MDYFIPYAKHFIDQQDINSVNEVLRSGHITQGKKIEEFEDKICKFTDAKFCILLANGTAALHLAVAALEIESNKKGITSPNTFVATSNALIYNNLEPKFVDIEKNYFNIDINKVIDNLNNEIRVIIPVHFAGNPVNIKKLRDLLPSEIKIIEDAAHAFGSNYSYGGKVGNCKNSDMTIFSFHPAKTITTGEGGAITTNDEILYEKLVMLRTHGITKNTKLLKKNPGQWYYEMQMLGFNYRISDIQASLGISQLKKINEFKNKRSEIYKKYNEAFSNIDNIKTPIYKDEVCYHLYVLQIDFDKLKISRKGFMEKLKEKGIGTQVHYIPVYKQPYYKEKYSFNDCPNTEEYYNKAISLPLYPGMSEADINRVINSVRSIL